MNNAKIHAIERLMEEITMQYDYRDQIRLADMERIIGNGESNDAENFKPKFDLTLLQGGASLEWIIKSRKKTLKTVLSNFTKIDHMRFNKQVKKSFTRKDGTCLLD